MSRSYVWVFYFNLSKELVQKSGEDYAITVSRGIIVYLYLLM